MNNITEVMGIKVFRLDVMINGIITPIIGVDAIEFYEKVHEMLNEIDLYLKEGRS